MPDGGAEKQADSAGIGEKLKYHFEELDLDLLVERILLDKSPLAKGETYGDKFNRLIGEAALRAAEKILPFIKGPDVNGALMNLRYLIDEAKMVEAVANQQVTGSETQGKIDLAIAKEKFREELSRLLSEMSELYEEVEGDPLRDVADVAALLRSKIKKTVEQTFEAGGRVYVLEDELGAGGIGSIHSCAVGDEDIVMKFFKKKLSSWANPPSYYREAYSALLRATKHPNLIDYKGYVNVVPPAERAKEDTIELGDNRIDVFEKLQEYRPVNYRTGTEEVNKVRVSDLLLPALHGLKALHDEGLVHCDFKPHNILFKENQGAYDVKLGDYDLLRSEGYEPEKKVLMGTLPYMSPEQIGSEKLTRKSDIFAVGMTLFYWYGGAIFNDKGQYIHERVLNKISDGELNKLNAPDEIKQLISDCVERSPRNRPDIDQVISRLKSVKKQIEVLHGRLSVADTVQPMSFDIGVVDPSEIGTEPGQGFKRPENHA